MSATGVGVLDNDPLALRMFRAVLHDRDGIDLLWLVSSPVAAVQSCLTAAARPDVLVTDMALEGIGGTSVCAKVKELSGSIRVIGVTAYRTDVYLDDAWESGMEAVVSKTRLDDLVVRILDEDAAHGGPPTREENGSDPTPVRRAIPSSCEARQSSKRPTPVGRKTLPNRELEVLGCFSRGLNSREAMDRLDITRSTLASYEHRTTVKLGARNRTEAVAVCIRRHLLP
ncbi:response regulator [uncultured Bifidobacterium sp.]|uniref:response regulator transcription factor n=1 Tax=uncultured Bifidobacterium sp. TaxID=165187 RepID=UPI002603F118|nr:response regulator [uncultured Bifidobacterium sp.]